MPRQDALPVVAVVGPTASGKSLLGVRLARLFGGEVVSADSKQIYQDMRIGTAVPTEEEREGVPHHLLQFARRDEPFSVAAYVKTARRCIFDIADRGKRPIVVGGTGLYVNALLDNMQFAEMENDPALRDELQRKAREKGGEYLHAKLAKVDPELAEKLHPNNTGRIIRAIEVYELTGKRMSQLQKEAVAHPSDFAPCLIGLDYRDRQKLYEKINSRVVSMVENGLLDELKALSKQGYSATAAQAIGYKEFFAYLDGTESLKTAISAVQMQTRRYAKRQLTWFRRDERIHWLYIDDYGDYNKIVQQSASIIQKETCWPVYD